MAFFHLNKDKKKSSSIEEAAEAAKGDKKLKRKGRKERSIPKSAISSGEAGGNRVSGYRAKFVQAICRNKAAQYAIIILSMAAILLYLFFSMATLSSLYYTMVKNAEAFESETGAVGVMSYEVNSDGTASFKTVDDIEYTDEIISFVAVPAGTLSKDTVYYVPSERVLVYSGSSDFALNFLWGNKWWVVVAYALILEIFRYYMAHQGGIVMKKTGIHAITTGMLLLLFLEMGLVFCLLS